MVWDYLSLTSDKLPTFAKLLNHENWKFMCWTTTTIVTCMHVAK